MSSPNKEYARKLALYEQLVATQPSVQRKGKTMPYTSLNGHMFSFLSKQGELGLRLPAEIRETFLREHEAELMEQYGRVMKEYVRVPDGLLADTQQLAAYFAQSLEYVGTLQPK